MTSLPRLRQLPLPLETPASYAAADFLEAASNEVALAWLGRTIDWPQRRLAIWGGADSGKTHLLHLWRARTGAALLSGPALRGLPPPPTTPLAIDDADLAADEAALLHVLNIADERGLAVLFTGRAPPARWQTGLPDLASRLRAVTAVRIDPAEDSLLRALFARLLSDRQLALSPGLADWLLIRLPRNPATLREAVCRLDRAALAAGGRVTRPIAAQVLADLTAAIDSPSNAQNDEFSVSASLAASTSVPGFL